MDFTREGSRRSEEGSGPYDAVAMRDRTDTSCLSTAAVLYPENMQGIPPYVCAVRTSCIWAVVRFLCGDEISFTGLPLL